jgi:tetratricopeptide (TPR) repeat protein
VTSRPPIFISAVSLELRSARQLVANTLTFLGYQPVWQDIFGTESGDLRGMLRHQIDQSKGVVQLVGHMYGSEPPVVEGEFGRVSYTQFEALYAKKRGRPVWYLFIDERFPVDTDKAEPEELKKLQAAYRARLQGDTQIFYPLSSTEGLEASVLKLRDDLTRLRRGVKQWAAAVLVLLLVLATSVFWLLRGQHQTKREVAESKQALLEISAEMKKLRESILQYPQTEAKVRESSTEKNPVALQERVYSELAKQQNIEPSILRQKLPQLAEQLKVAPELSSYERATAAYVTKDYAATERLALAAADKAKNDSPPRAADAVMAFTLAAWAAEAAGSYQKAFDYLGAAAALTDRKRGTAEWVSVQFSLGLVLVDLGRDAEAEALLAEVIKVEESIKGPEHWDTLSARTNRANALITLGRLTEAAEELKSILRLREKLSGPEAPATLTVRSNLATVLGDLGNYAEAEAEDRVILALREKLLGLNHPDTLDSRNNLAIDLRLQSKHEEAEREIREVLRLRSDVLGPEHPDTISARYNLALVLSAIGKYKDAEAEDQRVLDLRLKVLGPEHPDTIEARESLASDWTDQGRYAEAEAADREILAMRQKLLGPTHPQTLASRNSLAGDLTDLGRYEEAQAELKELIPLREKVLGPEHLDTLSSHDQLARVLAGQRKYHAAEAEFRVVLAARERALGGAASYTNETKRELGAVLCSQAKHAEAVEILRAALIAQEKLLSPNHPSVLETCFKLALCLQGHGEKDEARNFAKRAAENATLVLGPDHPKTRQYSKLWDSLVKE